MKYRKVISCHFSEGSADGGKAVGRVAPPYGRNPTYRSLLSFVDRCNPSGTALRTSPCRNSGSYPNMGLEGDKKGKVRSTNEI